MNRTCIICDKPYKRWTPFQAHQHKCLQEARHAATLVKVAIPGAVVRPDFLHLWGKAKIVVTGFRCYTYRIRNRVITLNGRIVRDYGYPTDFV